MGQNNRQRRAAKQKDRVRARAAATARDQAAGRSRAGAESSDGVGPGLADVVRLRSRCAALLEEACVALAVGRRVDAAMAELVELGTTPESLAVVRDVVAGQLSGQVRAGWARGWQPRDLQEFLGRSQERPELELLGDAMAADLATYPRSSVDDRWFDQLTAYGATLWWPASSSFLAARAARVGSWPVVLELAVRVLAGLRRLGRLEACLPPPGTASSARSRPRPAQVDDKMLFRVRQMLAKAESTTFEAEAQAFTAAAQKLMARHSIDQAMLTAADPAQRSGGPTGRRVWLATPYVKEKVLLLGAVARANRVQTVWSSTDDMVTLLGYDVDLEAVDTLFTSLLLQATQAMHAEGKRVTRGGSSRTRSFRASFLAAYAVRIGERLAAAVDAETEAAATDYRTSSGAELVPVLSARTEEVEDYAAQVFPHVVHKPVTTGRDREGWAKGRQAADQAQLRWGESLSGRHVDDR